MTSDPRSPYMAWAKSRPPARFDLAASGLLACELADLPGARDAVDIAGESPEGYPPLREAIASRYGLAPERVATAAGASGANFLVCAALLSPGDEALVETPHYDPLIAAARMLGARVETFPRRLENGWDLEPDAIASRLAPRTRLVVISNPHNPTGTLASEEALAALARLAEARGFAVLVDEVYLDAVSGPRPRPAVLRSERFVSTSSLTKAYGLASLRCGWAVAAPAVAEAIRRARDVVDVWSSMPADRLSVVAFRHLDALAGRAREIVRRNRDRVDELLAARPELECAEPRAPIAFPRLASVGDSGPFVTRLLEETQTAVTPGRFFGAPAHFRFAFGGDPARVAAGLAAIARTLRQA